MESFDAIEMFDQDKDDFIGERDWEGFSHGNFEIAQNDLFRYIHDYKGDARTKMAMIAIYLEGRDNLGKLMEAESFDAEGVPEGFHRMPDGTIMADSAHGAESFEASVDEGWDGVGWVDNPVGNPHAYLPKRFSQFPNYTVCQTCKDSGQGMRFYYDSKKKKMICLKCLSKDNYEAESFSAEKCQVCNCALTGKNSGGMNTYCDGCYGNLGMSEAESFSADNYLQEQVNCNYCGSDNIRHIKGYKCMNCANEVNYHAESFDASPDEEDYDDDDYEIAQRRSSNDEDGFQCYRCNLWYPTKDEMNDCIQSCIEYNDRIYDAESFDAQTKITGYTRGKDWEGKPYTGQIFPDHSDLDHELADRNQDGKMASWERAIGNQVARGKSRFKAPRKMLNPRLSQMKSSTTHSSILPYALAVGALATIMGLRNMGGSNE